MDFEPENKEGAYFTEFEQTVESLIQWLWLQIDNDDESVSKAAFQTLGSIKIEYFSPDVIPTNILETVNNPVVFDKKSNIEELNHNVFNVLLEHEGGELFISEVLRNEISTLPRNTAHNALRRQRQDKF